MRCCRVNCESVKRSTEAANSSCSRSFLLSRYAHYTLIAFNVINQSINQSINQFIILLTTSAGLRWVLLTLQHQAHSRNRPTATDEKKVFSILVSFLWLVQFWDIIKIVAARCHILKQKCTKFDSAGLRRSRPFWWSLERSPSPRPFSWI